MANFCSNCGKKVVENSLFCEDCGHKLTQKITFRKGVLPSSLEKPSRGKSEYVTTSSQGFHATPYRSSSQRTKWFIIGGFFIIVLIGASLVALAIIFVPFSFYGANDYEFVGNNTFSTTGLINNTEAPNNETNLILDISNSIGSVNIRFASISHLLEAQISVYAREGHSFQDADAFIEVPNENSRQVLFDSFGDNYYKYELDIIVSKHANASISAEVSTGSIEISAKEVTISYLLLQTSTGSINTYFENVLFVNISDTFSISTSTGSITSRFYDSNYSSNGVIWDFSVSVGSIDLGVFQETEINKTQVEYSLDVSTGSIYCSYQIDDSIGVSMVAEAPSGSISHPDLTSSKRTTLYAYGEGDHDSGSMIFNFRLNVLTGSIDINPSS